MPFDDVSMHSIKLTFISSLDAFNGAAFEAPGMSIVKFEDGTAQSYYSRDYYTEGDIMLGIPELRDAVVGFRTYYQCAVDPVFGCPF